MHALKTVVANATTERTAKRQKMQPAVPGNKQVQALATADVATAARSTAAKTQNDAVLRGHVAAAKITHGTTQSS